MPEDSGMQVAVYGAGAIGSLVGARLHESGLNVSLIGRRVHVDAIQANGLMVKGPDQSRLVRLPASTVSRTSCRTSPTGAS